MKKTEVITKIERLVSDYIFQNQTISVDTETYSLYKGEPDLQHPKVIIHNFDDKFGDTTLPNLKGSIEVRASKIGGNGIFRLETFNLEVTECKFEKVSNEISIGKINFSRSF